MTAQVDQPTLFATPPLEETPEEFIIWYANMSGKGEHVYAEFADGDLGFASRDMIIQGEQAKPVLLSFASAMKVREYHHARLGVMVWDKKGRYEIEEIWGVALAKLTLKHLRQAVLSEGDRAKSL